MRRSKGMTFVEVITAMLVTLIIGGSSALFLKSGLDMEQANTISATNQQSLRTPFLELTPLVERAGALEILATLPAAASLQPSEVVAYIADPKDSTNLTADQNNLYLRTRSGDKLVPGFSQIAAVQFERASLLSASAPLTSEDQAVRMTLTAKSRQKELVYSADVRSLNRVPVEGLNSGRFLKIDTRLLSLYFPFIAKAKLNGSTVESTDISTEVSLPVGTDVLGYFHVLAGDLTAEFEYEWRLYKHAVDVPKMQDYEVIGKDGAYAVTHLKKHYNDRFTSADLSASPPTGTTAHKQPPYLLELQSNMLNKHLAFAVRQKGRGEWVQSKGYAISKAQSQSSIFWSDLIENLKDDKAGKEGKKGEFILPGKGANINFGDSDPTTGEAYLILSGSGDSGRGFLSKELTEKYFKHLANGTRDPEFCLENYTIWVDAIVQTPTGGSGNMPSKGWGVFLNGNTKKLPNNHFHYGYMFQFDPGVEGWGLPGSEYSYNKSLEKNFENAQGVVIRKLEGDGHDGGAAHGIKDILRWKEKNDSNTKNCVPGWGYYFWGDVAYRGNPAATFSDEHGSYIDKFAVSGDKILSMRDTRYVTEINMITQTRKKADSSGTVAERIFFRVRVYDKPRAYNKAKAKWLFPEKTGRSKEMWFGVEGGKTLNWGLPYNKAFSRDKGNGFGRGDVMYVTKLLENLKIENMHDKRYAGDAIGKHFGLRVWADGNFDAKVYFVDIAKGLPLDFKLPWGTELKDIMKPIDQGGNWDPVKPYELQD